MSSWISFDFDTECVNPVEIYIQNKKILKQTNFAYNIGNSTECTYAMIMINVLCYINYCKSNVIVEKVMSCNNTS